MPPFALSSTYLSSSLCLNFSYLSSPLSVSLSPSLSLCHICLTVSLCILLSLSLSLRFVAQMCWPRGVPLPPQYLKAAWDECLVKMEKTLSVRFCHASRRRKNSSPCNPFTDTNPSALSASAASVATRAPPSGDQTGKETSYPAGEDREKSRGEDMDMSRERP